MLGQLMEKLILLTFNRTSMESKPCFHRHLTIRTPTFNRTSMESKLIILREHFLILLQTFNRTSMESKRWLWWLERCHFGKLLIEPVWNRN